MTLPNRIDPWGQFVATPARGTRMGNRGILHVPGQGGAAPVRKRQWRHRAWVCCVLAHEGWQRPVPLWSTPNHYSELFFLDEVTALAAGHRPCTLCQRERALAFKAAWRAAFPTQADRLRTADMDARLHAERTCPDGARPLHTAQLGQLPAGAVFAVAADERCAQPGDPVFVRHGSGGLLWSFAGYGACEALAADLRVSVLTPPAVVAVLQAGYVPQWHASAGFPDMPEQG